MLKPVERMGSSRADLKRSPTRRGAAWGLRSTAPSSGVVEVVARHDGDTFRAVYTVPVYVLHAFQKKAKRGIATPKQELDLVRRRLQAAERHYRDTHRGD